MPVQSVPQPGVALPYTGKYVIMPAVERTRPKEGYHYVPLSIQWNTDAGPGGVAFDLSGQGPTPLSQINSLYVDNSFNSQAIQIYFLDTLFTIYVPPYTEGDYNVDTKVLQFIVAQLGSIGATDITRITVRNFSVPPWNQNSSLGQQGGPMSSIAGLNINTATYNQTILAGPATLLGYHINIGNGGANAAGSVLELVLNIGAVAIWEGQLAFGASAAVPYTSLITKTGLFLPIALGQSLNLAATIFNAFAALTVTWSIEYRGP